MLEEICTLSSQYSQSYVQNKIAFASAPARPATIVGHQAAIPDYNYNRDEKTDYILRFSGSLKFSKMKILSFAQNDYVKF